MFYLRQADKRGRTQTDWLDSRHTFSFGQYYDPRFMAFSDLRVINDDVVAPSGGFGTHPHDNMEIVSVVFAGRLEHKDSLGSGSVIYARRSAGDDGRYRHSSQRIQSFGGRIRSFSANLDHA